MWIFSKTGFVDIVRNPSQTEQLLVRSQDRPDVENVVAILNEIDDRQYKIQDSPDGDYRFMVSADEQSVAQVVARLLTDIDYAKFKKQSVFFDFGQDPNCILSFTPAGVQLSKLQRDQ